MSKQANTTRSSGKVLRLGPGPRALDYKRYLELQELLREKRRELLLFCEHPKTLTAGVQAKPGSLLRPQAELLRHGIAHERIGRGGDYTAHEPGQCVIYPHIDIEKRGIPVSHFFAELLQITQISLRNVWSIQTITHESAPGLYTKDGAKIASIGIMFKRFFTSFGMAVNISNDLATFDWIHPCGDPQLRLTSIQALGGDPALLSTFVRVWEGEFRNRLLAPSRAG